MRVLAEIGAGGVDGQRFVTLVWRPLHVSTKATERHMGVVVCRRGL
eukprot:COSAG05_NODE_1224_length_5470_cov_4.161140_1_plen_45_part_10